MFYSRLLFSRSLTKDYRWMLIPEGASANDLQALLKLFYAFDRQKASGNFGDPGQTAIYLLRLASGIYIIRMGATSRVDEYGRNIVALQGLRVGSEQAAELKQALPYLLYRHIHLLNIWSRISNQAADTLVYSPSGLREYCLDTSIESIEKTFGLPAIPAVDPIVDRKYFSFDKTGFRAIILYFLSPNSVLTEFAFGAFPEALKLFPSIKIIAPAYTL